MKTCNNFPFSVALLSLVATALSVSCSKEKDLNRPDTPQQAVQFAATLPTRTTNGGDTWVAGDGVGIYMLTAGGTIVANTITGADNVRYNISDATTGALAPAVAANTIYFPPVGNVDFVAYYPYSTAITADGKYSVSLIDQSDPAAIDVLIEKVTGRSGETATPIPFTFTHALSKITLNLKADTDVSPAAVAATPVGSITLSQTPASAVIDLNDGTFTAGATGNIVLQKAATATAGYNATFTAIVTPHAAKSGRQLSAIIRGKTSTWDIPAADAFAGGNNYSYEATIPATGENNRITWDGNRYVLTDDPTDAGLFFKFGSVVGLYSANGALQTLPGTNADPFDVGDVAWSPVNTITGTGATGWATVPSYTAADYGTAPGRTVTPESGYHTAANVKLGKGDPCRLVGLDLAKIKSTAAGSLTPTDIDNGQWRLPTVAENRTFMGQPVNVTFTAHWTTQDGVNGGIFPVAATGNAATFLPAAGSRTNTATGHNSYGTYWTSDPYSSSTAFLLYVDISKVYPLFAYPYSYSFSIRCVRQ